MGSVVSHECLVFLPPTHTRTVRGHAEPLDGQARKGDAQGTSVAHASYACTCHASIDPTPRPLHRRYETSNSTPQPNPHHTQTRQVGIISQNPEKSKHLETATMRVGSFWIDFVNLRTESYTDGSRIPLMDIGGPEVGVVIMLVSVGGKVGSASGSGRVARVTFTYTPTKHDTNRRTPSGGT